MYVLESVCGALQTQIHNHTKSIIHPNIHSSQPTNGQFSQPLKSNTVRLARYNLMPSPRRVLACCVALLNFTKKFVCNSKKSRSSPSTRRRRVYGVCGSWCCVVGCSCACFVWCLQFLNNVYSSWLDTIYVPTHIYIYIHIWIMHIYFNVLSNHHNHTFAIVIANDIFVSSHRRILPHIADLLVFSF